MFLPNKIIKNKNLNYSQKNVGLAHGFKIINHVHGFKTMCTWFLCTWFMVSKPCARPPKQPIVLLYMV